MKKKMQVEKIEIKDKIKPSKDQILNLYKDAGWTAYTNEPEKLLKGIEGSLKVWTLWDGDILVGLARVVGDGHTIIYLQDLLILKRYQGQGLGSKVLKVILDEYKDIRQFILLTDQAQENINFYKKNGLKLASDYKSVAFMK